ncbi:hypothetical protein BGZ63DRAFT_27560 [Mariannaea sp. PMI_226]|nr:hypothetical protein BGZ63DRAFT_27560 [Mariannaea sp. PMI_226]
MPTMDSKRKANGTVLAESGDRANKRRKLASDFDLSKGETRESTTAYGFGFLEHIRRTADKSGRLVSKYFEHLLPRKGNEDYYKKTRMPISLETIEEKLDSNEFENLAQLESYVKRMIANAKDFYPRSSQTYDDAERIRKALSNYMTKNNPAYQTRGYQAQPTPLPPDSEDEEADEEADADVDGEADEDAEGEEDETGERGNSEDVDAESEEKEDEPEDISEEEEEEEEPASKKRSIILKRRGRPTRAAAAAKAQESLKTTPPARSDHQYEDVPYKGLNFQQAQEKLVEELLRHQEPEYEDAYFEAFINLPPRSLKDYFKVISDPLSIKKLQRMVRGSHGRAGVSGVSDFKTWAAFAEKSKLLWTNAYFYNEEGSEIYALAQELEVFFQKELKKAQAAVQEPSQAKIKLKVGQGPEPTPKKITIHVGGRGGLGESPAPNTNQTAEVPTSKPVVESAHTSTPAQSTQGQPENGPSDSAVTSPSPSTNLKAEDASMASPGAPPPPASATPVQAAPVVLSPAAQQLAIQQAALAKGLLEPKRFRGPAKTVDDALISRLRVQLHPGLQVHNATVATLFPHPTEMVQSATVNLPAHLNRVFIIPRLPDLLRTRQYSLWTVVNKQPVKPMHQQVPGQVNEERAFEAILHPGVNVVETHLIAALPRAERVPGGPEVELEVFTIFINLLRS